MAARESAQDVERRVGHPRDKWEALRDGVQDRVVKEFADVQDSWLDLMWTLDAYRIAQVSPPGSDLGALNRGKGNWFAEILALLLHNRTHHNIKARARVQGFSQFHQVDIAWPPRGRIP